MKMWERCLTPYEVTLAKYKREVALGGIALDRLLALEWLLAWALVSLVSVLVWVLALVSGLAWALEWLLA